MKAALILIDLQQGFDDREFWGLRNNPALETNVHTLLQNFRRHGRSVLHVQHLSRDRRSPLRPGHTGVNFRAGLEPKFDELVFQKSVHSAFIGTNLEAHLRALSIESLVFAGLTSDHCVSTSARMASDLGFKVIIAEDAVATFDRGAFPAQLVHEISMASLRDEFAEIRSVGELCAST